MVDRYITQAGLEAATDNATPTLRVTQTGLEVATLYHPDVYVTQTGLEAAIAGTLDEVWDDPVVHTAAMLEIYWDDAWVDETAYLRMDGGFDVMRSMVDPMRGLASMGQAPLGTATFKVANDSGRYSKTKSGSQAATYGLHGLPIRASIGYLTTSGYLYETVFTGRIVDAQNTEAGETATIYCRDEGETLLRQTASRPMNEGANSGDMVATFAAEGGLSGGDYNTDKGLFLVPYVYLEEDNLWSECQRMAASEGGLVYVDRSGILQFWNAAHFDTLSSVETYDESLYGECRLAYDYDNCYNVVKVEYSPRQESEEATVYQLRRVIVVPINGTTTETFQFRWPLASFESYTLAAVTGGGADISSDISIDPSTPQNAQSWTVEFTNANTVHAAYITTFEVAGRVAEGRPAEVYEADPDSVAGTKDARTLSVGSNFYIQSEGQARLLGNLLGDRLSTEVLTGVLTECPALPTLELGDLITVQCSNNEIDGDAVITGLHYTFGPAAKCDIAWVDATNLYANGGAYFVVGTSALGTGKLFY